MNEKMTNKGSITFNLGMIYINPFQNGNVFNRICVNGLNGTLYIYIYTALASKVDYNVVYDLTLRWRHDGWSAYSYTLR